MLRSSIKNVNLVNDSKKQGMSPLYPELSENYLIETKGITKINFRHCLGPARLISDDNVMAEIKAANEIYK